MQFFQSEAIAVTQYVFPCSVKIQKGTFDISKVKGFCFCEHGVGKNKSILLKLYYSRRRQNYSKLSLM